MKTDHDQPTAFADPLAWVYTSLPTPESIEQVLLSFLEMGERHPDKLQPAVMEQYAERLSDWFVGWLTTGQSEQLEKFYAVVARVAHRHARTAAALQDLRPHEQFFVRIRLLRQLGEVAGRRQSVHDHVKHLISVLKTGKRYQRWIRALTYLSARPNARNTDLVAARIFRTQAAASYAIMRMKAHGLVMDCTDFPAIRLAEIGRLVALHLDPERNTAGAERASHWLLADEQPVHNALRACISSFTELDTTRRTLMEQIENCPIEAQWYVYAELKMRFEPYVQVEYQQSREGCQFNVQPRPIYHDLLSGGLNLRRSTVSYDANPRPPLARAKALNRLPAEAET